MNKQHKNLADKLETLKLIQPCTIAIIIVVTV